jgi:hypothetical protein
MICEQCETAQAKTKYRKIPVCFDCEKDLVIDEKSMCGQSEFNHLWRDGDETNTEN